MLETHAETELRVGVTAHHARIESIRTNAFQLVVHDRRDLDIVHRHASAAKGLAHPKGQAHHVVLGVFVGHLVGSHEMVQHFASRERS